jgi:hypothetical protein
MALPQARSYPQILGDIFDTFLSKTGFKRLKIGGPIVSALEASAQSDVRATQDVFQALDSFSLDRTFGDALTRIAADENLTRIPLTSASGLVNFSDTSFTKISSTVYQGAGAPNIGTTSLKVTDATAFPTAGSVYVGRNTVNYEGPLVYTSKTNVGPYWTLTLSVGTTKFHNLGETVILAKGGIRAIPAGTVVQTPQGNVSDAIGFTTLYNAQIEDGETAVNNIEVVAQQGGVIGNVPADVISVLPSPPYNGAAVTNPLPFTNGLAEESDTSLKERIKKAKQSRQRGTSLALTSGVIGITSSFDNKTVISSSIILPQTNQANLFIDDGTGYEEATASVAQEILMDSASGGEQYFQLSSQRPIAKAFLTSTSVSPFLLNSGDKLSVLVGGVLSEHTFDASQFKTINNADAFEVIASINGDSTLLFNARTINNGQNLVLFSKNDINEDISITTPSVGNDANVALGFPTGLEYTVRLYKNDQFLYKDGKPAVITTAFQNTWSNTIANGDTLQIQVDSTATQTVTINDSDFVSNSTGFTTVNSNNSLASWATVLNAKIAGITATVGAGLLNLQSNSGNLTKAKITIIGGTLVSKGMFSPNATSTGANNDYTLNRNTGQLKLTTPLISSDSLVAATSYTQGYLQSSEFATASVTLGGTANLWFAVDSDAAIVTTAVNSATTLTITSLATNRARYTATNNTFGSSASYLKVGDWVVIWDPQFTDKGAWRVSDFDSVNFSWFEVERGTVTAEAKAPTSLGIVFVRTNEQLQNIQIGAGTYSLTAIATNLNSVLIGATASVFRNTKLRVNTNSYKTSGNIILITADVEGAKLQLPTGKLVYSNPSHFAVIESGNKELGTPNFKWTSVATTPSATTLTTTVTPTNLPLRSGDMLAYRKRLDVPAGNKRYGADAYDYQKIQDITSGVITPRTNTKTSTRLVSDRIYAASPFGLGYEDNLQIILDQDDISKNYGISLFRNIKPDGAATYGAAAFEVKDVDNSNATLFGAFGASTNFFNDFALFMRARGKSHSITANKTILWRYPRYGSGGNYGTVAYVNPSAPSSSFAISTDTWDGNSNINISLPSGAERVGLGTNGANSFVVTSNTTYSVGTGKVARNANVVTVTLANAGVTNTHTLSVGDQVYQTSDENGAHVFRKGPKAITAITANTFSYAETGANETASNAHSYLVAKRPAGTSNTVSALAGNGATVTATIGAHVFQVGDTVYLSPGHFDAASGVLIAAGAKTVTAIGGTTVSWAEVTVNAAANLIAGVTYTVSSGQCQKIYVDYFKAEVAIGNLTRVGTTVTATINTTPIISQHPFAVGDIVFLSPGEADFAVGPKIITSVTNTTFTYTEAGSAVSSGAAIQYFTSTSTDPNFTGGGTPVTAGHIVHIDTSTSFNSNIQGNFRVFDVSSTKFSFLKDDASYTGNAVPKKINAINNLRFYPIDSASATASAIQAWIASNAANIVSATLVPNNGGGSNNGSAQVATATVEEFYLTTNNASIGGANSQSVKNWSLFDGLNFIKATNIVGTLSSTLALKDSVSGELTSNADFANENMRLVPISVTNLTNYLGSTGVSGFAANSLISASLDGAKLQLGSSTIGSGGAIQIAGGTGNLATATIIGTGSDINATYSKVVINSVQAKGLFGGAWVSVQGTNNMPKVTGWGAGNTMAIVATANPNEWKIQFDGGVTAVNVIQVIHATQTYQIEKQGNFIAYIDNSSAPTALSTNIKEGDWVYINAAVLSSVNTGFKQVVRVDTSTNTFWVENTLGVEEIATFGTNDYVKFITYDSAVPGDTLNISTSILGNTNVGSFTVSKISENIAATTANEFYVLGSMAAIGATTLGSNYIFVSLKEKSPIRFIKKIRTINVNSSNVTNVDVVFSTSSYATKMSEAAGSIITALDKLAFNTSINVGLDGYRYNTGLLAEVNRVVYGDESNPSVYPGIVAAGGNVNISGPLVKRILVSLAIRLRTGVTAKDVIDRVKSAIAALINAVPIGTDIALASVVSAAEAIDGVTAVTILSPTYSSGNDLITVQASEKPLILDITQDILVSVVS